MQLNLLDRAISAVAPAWGAQRAKNRAQILMADLVTDSTGLNAMGAGDSNETVSRSSRW